MQKRRREPMRINTHTTKLVRHPAFVTEEVREGEEQEQGSGKQHGRHWEGLVSRPGSPNHQPCGSPQDWRTGRFCLSRPGVGPEILQL